MANGRIILARQTVCLMVAYWPGKESNGSILARQRVSNGSILARQRECLMVVYWPDKESV